MYSGVVKTEIIPLKIITENSVEVRVRQLHILSDDNFCEMNNKTTKWLGETWKRRKMRN